MESFFEEFEIHAFLCVDCLKRVGGKASEGTVKPVGGNIGGGGVRVLSPPIGGSRNARLNLAAFRSFSVTVHAAI